MEEIKQSEHKDYLPSYPFSTGELIELFVLPNQKEIFLEIAEKLHQDAENDWKKGRKFLQEQGGKASRTCKRISEISGGTPEKHGNKQLVEELINMDYASVANFFKQLSSYYDENSPLFQELKNLKELFESMRKVSEKHTKVISKELLDNLM